MSNVAQTIKKIIIEQLGVDSELVVENARFVDDLVIDSMSSMALSIEFEEAFDIEIPDDTVGQIKTVGDIIRFVTERL